MICYILFATFPENWINKWILRIKGLFSRGYLYPKCEKTLPEEPELLSQYYCLSHFLFLHFKSYSLRVGCSKYSLWAAPVSPWLRQQLGCGPGGRPPPQPEPPPFSAANEPPCPRGLGDSHPTRFCIHEAKGKLERKKAHSLNSIKLN